MPHLTGLASAAVTDSSADKSTTAATLTDGLSLWKDPMAAFKELPNIGQYFKENPEKGLGFVIVPVGLFLIVMSMMQAKRM